MRIIQIVQSTKKQENKDIAKFIFPEKVNSKKKKPQINPKKILPASPINNFAGGLLNIRNIKTNGKRISDITYENKVKLKKKQIAKI